MGLAFEANNGSITATEGNIITAAGSINLSAGHSFTQDLALISGQDINIYSNTVNITSGDGSFRLIATSRLIQY